MSYKLNVSVSVVIPCFNSEKTIIRALNSIKKQTSLPSEVIIINDSSTDRTTTILNELITLMWPFEIIILTNDKNSGPSYSRNRGWNIAKYDWIAFLDADDTWDSNKLEIQLGEMANQNFEFSGHITTFEHKNSVRSTLLTKVYYFKNFLVKNRVNTPSVIISRHIPLRFDTTLTRAEDYDLWLRVCLAGYPCLFICKGLCFVHKPLFGAGGLSKSLYLMEKGELHVLLKLMRSGSINIFTYGALTAFSLLKFFRRIVITWAKK